MKVNVHLANTMNGVAGKIDRPKKTALFMLILLIIISSLIPLMPVMAISAPDLYNDSMDSTNDEGDKGDTIIVTSPIIFDVTPGANVNVYWDAVSAWDGEKGLLNSTVAEASGEYEVWFDVPEAVAGTHYVWVKDMDAGDTAVRPFVVLTKVKVSPSSGLEGDTMTIKGYGFDDERDVAVLLVDQDTLPDGTNMVGEIGVPTTDIDGVQTDYTFTLDNKPLEPGSALVTDYMETFTDDGDGTLTGNLGGSGTVNYITGYVSVGFNTAPTGYAAITADYEYYDDDVDTIYIFSTTVDSDELGSFVKEATVPDEYEMARGLYYVHGYDAKGNTDSDDFTIGAVIALDVEEGPTGTVVEIRGRGFDPAQFIQYGEITITNGANPIDCCIVNEPPGGVDVKDDGDFKLEIVIPTVDDIDDYDTIEVTDGYTPAADAEFEVTGLAEIEVDPDFGLPGSTINIKGCNFTQISGEEVNLELWDEYVAYKIVDIDTFYTDDKGEFNGTFSVPAIPSGVYTLMASQEGHGATDDYNIHVDTSFSIHFAGIVVVVTPSRGPTGTEVTLTGTGFTESDAWNASFGDISIFDSEITDGTGSLSESFIVPTVDVGTYTVTVLDEDTEIEVETEYTVTATTMVELIPLNAPNDYNVTIEGWYFTGIEGTDIEAVLYNVTDVGDVDEYWNIDLFQMWDHDNDPDTPRVVRDAETDEDGNFTAYWYVPDEDILSVGDYILNITTENPGDGPDLFAQTMFGVCAEFQYRFRISPYSNVVHMNVDANGWIQGYMTGGTTDWNPVLGKVVGDRAYIAMDLTPDGAPGWFETAFLVVTVPWLEAQIVLTLDGMSYYGPIDVGIVPIAGAEERGGPDVAEVSGSGVTPKAWYKVRINPYTDIVRLNVNPDGWLNGYDEPNHPVLGFYEGGGWYFAIDGLQTQYTLTFNAGSLSTLQGKMIRTEDGTAYDGPYDIWLTKSPSPMEPVEGESALMR